MRTAYHPGQLDLSPPGGISFTKKQNEAKQSKKHPHPLLPVYTIMIKLFLFNM